MGKKDKQQPISLYEKGGWVNIPALARLGCWCYVIIGKRQVGKTYGTLKYMLEQNKYFLYLRRTSDEFDAVCADPVLNPFLPLEKEGYTVDIAKNKSISYTVGDYEKDEDGKHHIVKPRAVGMTLTSISKIRGFNGSMFSDVVFDEFIPERIVVKRKAEGDAMLNAYVTINGNRELEGKPPLRLWLLANAFDMANGILMEMGLIPVLAKMMRQGLEYYVTDTGICVAMPKSEEVTDKRSQTAFIKHMAKQKNSKFYQMAMENKFSYNDLSNVRPMQLTHMIPAFVLDDMYVYEYDTQHYYVCRSRHDSREKYGTTSDNKKLFRQNYPWFQAYFSLHQVWCSDIEILIKLKEYLDIKD